MKSKFRKSSREETRVVAEQAAEWLDRLTQEDGARYNAEFLRWLKQSPLHIREMLVITTWDRLFDYLLDPDHKIDIDQLQLLAAANVVPMDGHSGDDIPFRMRPAPKRRARGWMMIAGAAAAVTLAVAMGWTHMAGGNADERQYGTTLGEQRSLSLADGSVIHLNTHSSVRIAFNEQARDVYLLEGQAIFKVKHDAARPFRVHVDSTVVQAIGTQFDVYRLNNRTSVAVIEGVVQIIPTVAGKIDADVVSKLPASSKVPAGEKVEFVPGGKPEKRTEITAEDAGAWQQRRLVFQRNTLEEIANEFNRYNRTPQMRIEGAELKAQRFSGVFDADDPESFLELLALDQLTYGREGNALVVRLRTSVAQSAPQK